MRNRKKVLRLMIAAALLPLAACSDLLDVESPGRIEDSNLNNKDAIEGLVAGMKYDLSQAVDGSGELLALFSTDLHHGGSYALQPWARGDLAPDDVGTPWSSPQQARWVAENGLERLLEQEILTQEEFNRHPLVAEAYLYAGFANRMLGETFCSSTIDGGPEIPHTDHFGRAADHFTSAISIGQASGRDDVVEAGYAGRASMRAWLGDWDGAVNDASQVSDDFVFYAEIDTEMRNELAYETHSRFEYTVFNTDFADHYGDPRLPWDTIYNADGSIAQGANGSTPHFQQNKYPEGSSDVPLVKGTEMLILRAEAALRDDNIPLAYQMMNQAREEYGMDPLPVATTMDAAWDDLHFERRATVWLEGRAQWDLRRWFQESGPAHHDALADRDKCVPIAQSELDANENFRG